jgi:hypothetical protein
MAEAVSISQRQNYEQQMIFNTLSSPARKPFQIFFPLFGSNKGAKTILEVKW